MPWNLEKELGDAEEFERLIRAFYDRLFDDIIVGFLFQPHDKEKLVQSQMDYLRAHLGDRSGSYEGPSIRDAHAHVPVLPGHFDRRHKILSDLLDEWSVPDHVREAWLALDVSLRKFVVHLGATARDRIGDAEE